MTIRVDHRTVTRTDLRHPPAALAAADGDCPDCGGPVDRDEPVTLRGQHTMVDPDGVRTVDLSGAEWGHQRCRA